MVSTKQEGYEGLLSWGDLCGYLLVHGAGICMHLWRSVFKGGFFFLLFYFMVYTITGQRCIDDGKGGKRRVQEALESHGIMLAWSG